VTRAQFRARAIGVRWRLGVAAAIAAFVALALWAVPMAAPANPSAIKPAAASVATTNQETYRTTQQYVIRNYPRYMTHFQQSNGAPNRLVGPAGMGPQYGIVVAINDDTLYASAFVDVSSGPEIFTIPKPGTVYSLLTLDLFGDVFKTTIPSQAYGRYALVEKGYSGPIPAGTTRVEVPYRTSVFIVRADKYSSSGQNLTRAAQSLRTNLRLASMADYLKDPTSGRTTLLPIGFLAYRMKSITDDAATTAPTAFLARLQTAVNDPTTQPMTASDRKLATTFDQTYAAANAAAARGDVGPLNAMAQATRDAHALIVDNWLSHADATGWIHPENVGNWGTDYLDRASLNEYIQYGNDASAAQYFDAFADHNGAPLDTHVVRFYQIKFTKDEIPDATRFWSLTAYVPGGITLVPNRLNKYVVAGYTPGLKKAADGSVTVTISAVKPPTVPTANWLPAPPGPFSLLLRVYGPTGNTTQGYTPPPIQPYGAF
jgi:hypothetical protein